MLKDNAQKPTNSETASPEKIEKLESLFALKEKGAISEEEYNQEKAKLLNAGTQRKVEEKETAQPVITSVPKQEVKKEGEFLDKITKIYSRIHYSPRPYFSIKKFR